MPLCEQSSVKIYSDFHLKPAFINVIVISASFTVSRIKNLTLHLAGVDHLLKSAENMRSITLTKLIYVR